MLFRSYANEDFINDKTKRTIRIKHRPNKQILLRYAQDCYGPVSYTHLEINQYFAALTNMRSVGVMGDFRTYDYAVALRAVKTCLLYTSRCV